MAMFFKPILAGAQWPARLLACVGAAMCLALTFVVCARLPLTHADLPIEARQEFLESVTRQSGALQAPA